ncbi:claw keratin-like [Ruditapes philippinarum]|uniref:claw keratin-like n=1 Tax=Ruditapes philippinarum TaxID=129788 RepID=UPI00295B9984|nr:claw keratin-like [Ruditapes philippinarum]
MVAQSLARIVKLLFFNNHRHLQPTPKKHRTVIGPPQAVPVPVLPRPGFLPRARQILPPPPPLISPYAGLGGFGYGGLGGLGRFGGLGGLGGMGGLGPLGALALREALD